MALDRGQARGLRHAGARVTVWTLTARPRARSVRMLLAQSWGTARASNARYGADDRLKISTRSPLRGHALRSASAAGARLSLAARAPIRPAELRGGQAGTTFAGFCDRSVDAQMDRAASTQVHDPAEGIRLWQRVEDASLGQLPIIPAFNSTSWPSSQHALATTSSNPHGASSSASSGSARPGDAFGATLDDKRVGAGPDYWLVARHVGPTGANFRRARLRRAPS